ncbi:MAG: hypothetical protein HY690_07425 [Chloroflexi bacterium]|nr:hypothetical protein [Chloroflexota bacterium]
MSNQDLVWTSGTAYTDKEGAPLPLIVLRHPPSAEAPELRASISGPRGEPLATHPEPQTRTTRER